MTEIAFTYNPHDKQRSFHERRYKDRYRAIFAGTGSGKTLAGIFEDLSWCMENPGIVGYVYEPTYIMVRRILLPTLENKLLLGNPIDHNPLVKEYMRGDKKIEFINGSQLWFGSLEDPEMSEGPNVDFIHVDETRLVRDLEAAWKTIRRRLRGSKGEHYPRGAWITTTPDAPIAYDEKHKTGSVMYSFFEDPKTKNPSSSITRMSIYDNKRHLGETFIRDIEESHTGGYAERFIYGRFAEVGVGSFEFDSTRHLGEFNMQHHHRVAYGMDWGWTNPACILKIVYDGDDRAYVCGEFYKSRATDEELMGEAKAMSMGDPGTFYCDPSEPKSIDKLCHSGVQAVGNKSKRDEGIREIGSRLRNAGDSRPRLFISPSCVNLISELQTFREDRKERDHAVDALRYCLMGSRSGGVWIGR